MSEDYIIASKRNIRIIYILILTIISIIVLYWLYIQITEEFDSFYLRMTRSIIDGMALSMLLFIMVSGFFLIFGLADVINFAHGAFFMIGGFIGYEMYLYFEFMFININLFDSNPFLWSMVSFVLALLGTAIILGLIGGGIEFFTLRRLYGNALGQILLTIGFLLIITKIAELLWGSAAFSFFITPSSQRNYFFLDGSIDLGVGLVFQSYRVLIIFIGLTIALVMYFIISRTRIGLLVQASIEDSEMVQALGTNVKLMLTFVFITGTALAGLAGVILVPWLGANSGYATNYLLFAFVIVVVGGAHYGRLEGTFFGSLIVGLSIKFTEFFFPVFSSIIIFVIMALVLVFKPGGLTGE